MCLTKALLFLTKAYLPARHLVLIWGHQEERIHHFVSTLFQWLSILTIKNVGHVSNLNVPGSRFHPLDLITLLRAKSKSSLTPIIFFPYSSVYSLKSSHVSSILFWFFLISFGELWKFTGFLQSFCVFFFLTWYLFQQCPDVSHGASNAHKEHRSLCCPCPDLLSC